MKYFFLIIICGLFACKQNNHTTQISADTIHAPATSLQTTGWIKLFNGNNFNGWHSYGESIAGAAWKVENGEIHLDASKKNDDETIGGGDLVTNDEYENFDLKLEWKISKGGNSGVRIYINEDTGKYEDNETGIEMQIVDNENNADGKIAKHRAGALYDVIAPNTDAAKVAGEWNDAEIVCNKGQLEFYINNIKVVSAILWNDNWKKLVAQSKFKNMPGWGTFKKGHISLQDHGYDVWYKNIIIKKL